jgi:Tfp pilus assembly protein PilF
VYVVDQRALEPTPGVIANGYFNDGEWDAAVAAYTKALEGNPDDRFLAYLGLGSTYMKQEQYAQAAENYEAALELDPESSVTHELLASAYDAVGEEERARTEFERAIELAPENAELRLRYGMFLASVDRRAAVEQHRAVVEMYPKVPEYRVKLGAALVLTGNPEVADEQFERAARLDPLSARLQADIAGANQAIGRPEEALRYYERALNLEPNSQLYALNLGRIHALLSTRNGHNEEHFEEAESLLRSVDELGHPPWEADQREAASIALGDLYLEWNRPEDAAAAYERALELNPASEKAKEKLTGLQR